MFHGSARVAVGAIAQHLHRRRRRMTHVVIAVQAAVASERVAHRVGFHQLANATRSSAEDPAAFQIVFQAC